MVNMGEIFAYDRIFKQDMDRVPVSEKEYDKSILKKGDLLFARQSLTLKGAGKCSIVMTDEEMTFESHLIRARLQKEIADPMFYYYLFKSKIGKELISSIVEQVAAAGIRGSDLVKLKVPVPVIMEQRKISEVLSKIDDKIELNNAINKNLEEMAQALFKRWFVDFEFPNENGEPYKSSGGEFEESELGLIPKGWRVRPLIEILEVNPKRTLKKGVNAPYVEMKSITNYYARVTEHSNREFKSGTKFMNGDVLLARITPCLENGKTAYVDFLEENQVGWGSTEYIILRSRQGIPYLFAYFLARSDEFRLYAIYNMTGTSGRQRVPEASVSSYPVAIPDTFELFEKFGNIVHPGFELMKKNDLETHSLNLIRDTLLPKLMSGEIRVPLDQA